MGQTRPVFIDVEASGFGAGSYPIEVGCALDDASTRCYLIQPMPDWTGWDESAEAVHRISRDLLKQRGRDPLEVARELNVLLGGRKVYSDAWGQDMSWLGRLYEACGICQRFALGSVRELLSDAQAACWHQTKCAVLEELNLTRHRASSDALVLQTTFTRVSQTQ